MSTFYNAALVVAAPDADTERATSSLADALIVHHAAVTTLRPGWLLVRVSVRADSLAQAAATAVSVVAHRTRSRPGLYSVMSESDLEERLALHEPVLEGLESSGVGPAPRRTSERP